MKRGIGLVSGIIGVGVVSTVIFAVMSTAGNEIYRSLTEGPPGVRAPDAPGRDPLFAPEGPIAHVVEGDGALGEHLRTSDGLLASSIRQGLAAQRTDDEATLRRSFEALGPALRSVNLEDPTGRDVQILISALKEGEPEARLAAARGLSYIGDGVYVRPILTASAGAEDPLPYCLAALGILARQDPSIARRAVAEIAADRRQEMHPACRGELNAQLDAWSAQGSSPQDAGAGAAP